MKSRKYFDDDVSCLLKYQEKRISHRQIFFFLFPANFCLTLGLLRFLSISLSLATATSSFVGTTQDAQRDKEVIRNRDWNRERIQKDLIDMDLAPGVAAGFLQQLQKVQSGVMKRKMAAGGGLIALATAAYVGTQFQMIYATPPAQLLELNR
jgi:hypothetical protein